MYEIKEIQLEHNEHIVKRPVIIFHDENQAILGEFLMTEITMLEGELVHLLETLLAEGGQEITYTGQRCQLEMGQEETSLTDLYEDIEGMKPLAPYRIGTEELLDLIKVWQQHLRLYE